MSRSYGGLAPMHGQPESYGAQGGGYGELNGASFSPQFLSGLSLWLDAGAGVQTDGAAQFTAAQNQYLQLDATSSQFSVANGSFTVGGWVWLDALSGGSQTLISKYTNTSSGNLDWSLQVSTGSALFTAWDSGAAQINASGGSLSISSWYFLVGRYDAAAKTISLSINGTNTDSKTFVGSPTSSSSKLVLGGRDNAGVRNPLGGRLDSVAFWSRALSDAEVLTLYNSAKGFTYASLPGALQNGLVSWWDLDERAGTANGTPSRFDSKGSNHLTGYSDPIISGPILNGDFETGGTGGTISNVPVATRARTSNIATIVTSIPHGLSTGNAVTLTGFGGAGYNVTNSITKIDSTTFTCPSVGSDEATTADTGGRVGTQIFDKWTSNASGGSMVLKDTVLHDGGSGVSAQLSVDSVQSACSIAQTIMIAGSTYFVSGRFYTSNSAAQCYLGSSAQSQVVVQGISGSWFTIGPANFIAASTVFEIKRGFAINGTPYTMNIDSLVLTTNGPTPAVGVTVGAASDGDPMATWPDASSSGRDAAQTGSAFKPIYKPASIGPRAAALFDGMDDRLDIPPIDMSGDMTMFAVVRPVSTGVPGTIWGNRFAVSGSDQCLTIQVATNGNVQVAFANNSGTFNQFASAASNMSSNNNYVISATRDCSGLTATCFLNGAPGSVLTGMTFPTKTTCISTIGRDFVTNPFSGYVGEIIVYRRLLSAVERRQVEFYLGAKYGVTMS